MKINHFVLIALTLFGLLLASCDNDPTTNPDGGAANPANLSATVSKNYTVSLSWNSLEETLTLERKVKGSEADFATLADVTGQTSFEDFPVLDTLTYSYRLNSEADSSEITIDVPAVTPNPLTVTLTAETDKSVKQTISKSGGSLSVTGNNGVVYTLTVPADALLKDTEITLTPISAVGNLPLSGGLLGAVKIEPEGLEFYNYVTLTVTGTATKPASTEAIAFASSTTGTEFHFYPFAATTPVIQAQQNDGDAILPPLIPNKGGTYGVGAGTTDDVKRQVQNNPPTDSEAQTNQQTASTDDADLVPLTTRGFARYWDNGLESKEVSAPSSQTKAVFREYRQWLEFLRKNGLEQEFDASIKAHSQRQATRISKRFDELYITCEEGDRSVRKEMKELINWSRLYPALVQNLGEAWFSEAQDRVTLCGIPDWQGSANSEQPEALVNGYTESVDITWVVKTVVDDIVTYEAQPSNLKVDIASGNGATVTVNSATFNPERSFLIVDYSTTPATYGALVQPDVDFTITYEQGQTQTLSGPFAPIMYTSDMTFQPSLPLSDNDRVMTGNITDAETTYSSTWSFTAIPGTKQ